MCFKDSVTRWLNCISILGHLQQWKLAQKCNKFAKVILLFCQIRNKPSKICQRLVKYCQSGEIAPNQVSLAYIDTTTIDNTATTTTTAASQNFYLSLFPHLSLRKPPLHQVSPLPLFFLILWCQMGWMLIQNNGTHGENYCTGQKRVELNKKSFSV